MESDQNTTSVIDKTFSRNGARRKASSEGVSSLVKESAMLLDTLSQPSSKSSLHQNKSKSNSTSGSSSKSLHWMFSRFGIKTRNKCEVASAGPSGLFKQVTSDESRSQEKTLEHPDWPPFSSQYELGKIIGFGATAKVYESTCSKNGRICAIKKIFLDNEQVSFVNLWKETRGMMLCHHENILEYFTSFVDNKDLWIVLGYMNGGSVLDIVEHCVNTRSCKNGILEEKFISSVLKQVISGLAYMHDHGLIHRDIKAGNLLFNMKGDIKIADFGVSTHFTSANDKRLSFIGTPCWMAPEVIQQHNGYDIKADIWSLGITAIEMATGKVPNQRDPTLEVIIKTLRNTSPTLDSVADHEGQYSKYSHVYRRFIHICLKKEPESRAYASDLLKTSFIKSAGDSTYIADQLLNYLVVPIQESRIIHPFFDKNFRDLYQQEDVEWDFEDQNAKTDENVELFPNLAIEGYK